MKCADAVCAPGFQPTVATDEMALAPLFHLCPRGVFTVNSCSFACPHNFVILTGDDLAAIRYMMAATVHAAPIKATNARPGDVLFRSPQQSNKMSATRMQKSTAGLTAGHLSLVSRTTPSQTSTSSEHKSVTYPKSILQTTDCSRAENF